MTANIYEINHFYNAIQSFMDFFSAKSAYICMKYDNKVIVDLCCKSGAGKDISYKNSGLDYRIEQFLEVDIVRSLFPDFIFVAVNKGQSFEEFLKMTRAKSGVIKIPQPLPIFSTKKEYAEIS